MLITSTREDVKQVKLSYFASWNTKWYSHVEKPEFIQEAKPQRKIYLFTYLFFICIFSKGFAIMI
jgi:hypothetical protein